MPNTSQETKNTKVNTSSLSRPRTQQSTRPTSPSGKNGGRKNTKYGQKHRKLAPKTVVKRGPVNEYISVCCSLPAEKPACGSTLATQTEGKKVIKVVRGLGHFRCTGCHKAAKVTARKPQPKVETPLVSAVEVQIAAEMVKEVPSAI